MGPKRHVVEAIDTRLETNFSLNMLKNAKTTKKVHKQRIASCISFHDKNANELRQSTADARRCSSSEACGLCLLQL